MSEKLQKLYLFPVHLYGVSTFLQGVVQTKTRRKLRVIPCSYDEDIFYPGTKFSKPTVLVVGDEDIEQKQIRPTIDALLELCEKFPFDILWVTPVEKKHPNPLVRTIVNPTQKELAGYFRSAHLYVTASKVEGFSLPPLEAMASGTAIIATDSGGNREYCVPNVNMLHFPADEWGKMKQYVRMLLENEHKRVILEENGIQTAKNYTQEKIASQTVAYYEALLLHPFIAK